MMIMDKHSQVTRFRIRHSYGYSLRADMPALLHVFSVWVYTQALSPARGHRCKDDSERENQSNSVDRAKRLFHLSEIRFTPARQKLAGRPKPAESVTAALPLRATRSARTRSRPVQVNRIRTL